MPSCVTVALLLPLHPIDPDLPGLRLRRKLPPKALLKTRCAQFSANSIADPAPGNRGNIQIIPGLTTDLRFAGAIKHLSHVAKFGFLEQEGGLLPTVGKHNSLSTTGISDTENGFVASFCCKDLEAGPVGIAFQKRSCPQKLNLT